MSTMSTHPGSILWNTFMVPMNITCYRLAKDLGVPVNRITAIVHEKRAISVETALMLSHYFDVSEDLWCNLQTCHDIRLAREVLRDRLNNIPICKYA